jgi:hypothetical protein
MRFFHPIFTEVIVKDPPTGKSLKKLTPSFPPVTPMNTAAVNNVPE